MKIVSVETLCLDLSGQDAIAFGVPVFVRVTTDDGTVGLGELGMVYGVGAKAGPAMILALAGRFLLGQDPIATETLWESLLRLCREVHLAPPEGFVSQPRHPARQSLTAWPAWPRSLQSSARLSIASSVAR